MAYHSEANSGLQEQTALKAEVMAELARNPFNPPWWLKNPHGQTVGARYIRRIDLPQTRLERFDTPDDDFLRIHFIDGHPDAPVGLILHGLEGSLESTYVLGLILQFKNVGWNSVIVEHRSCGGEMNRGRRMYHSGETSDLAFVVDALEKRWPGKPIYVAGYSLSGNQLAKWLGEEGDRVPEQVRAAAVISAPYDLVESAKFLDTGIRQMYVRHFLRMLIPKAIEKNQQYPGILDIEKIKQARTFKDFDDHATAPLHGFEDAHDYYTRVSCGQFLHGVRRPTMLLSAHDDPFNPGSTLPHALSEQSPYLHPQFAKHGGHVGFVRAGDTGGVGYWAEEQVLRFFLAYHERT